MLLTATFAACNNEEIVGNAEPAPMLVTVNNNIIARTFVGGQTLPGQSTIGVQLVDNSGTTYENLMYKNVPYYSENGINWSVPDGTNTPVLYSTVGKSIAYYPYNSTITDIKQIPVTTAEQNDYMYSDEVSVDYKNNEAAYNMNHALAGIRLTIIKNENHDDVTINKITVESDGFAASATLDATTGILSNVTGKDEVLTHEETFNVTTDGKQIGFVAIPATTATAVTFKVETTTIRYTATVALNNTFKQGYVYDYTLSFNAEKLIPSPVTVSVWKKGNGDEGENLGMQIDPWSLPNGVYAVSPEGKPVEVANATTECTAVALIVNDAPTPQRLMIAKADATDGTNTTLYWGKNLYAKNVAGIDNQETADRTNAQGYFSKSGTPQLSTDYTTWTSGALSDFNGKANTAAIIAAYTEHAVEMNSQDMCKVLQDLNATEDANWYVPACGQLALIYLNMTAINEALTAIGGTAFSDSDYWSSSEYDTNSGWYVNFSWGGLVNDSYKSSSLRVRFVQNI